jgi:hypothetical protein
LQHNIQQNKCRTNSLCPSSVNNKFGFGQIQQQNAVRTWIASITNGITSDTYGLKLVPACCANVPSVASTLLITPASALTAPLASLLKAAEPEPAVPPMLLLLMLLAVMPLLLLLPGGGLLPAELLLPFSLATSACNSNSRSKPVSLTSDITI